MSWVLNDLLKSTIDSLEERINESGQVDSDDLHEIADSMIPVYTSDILELACDNLRLACEVSDDYCSDWSIPPTQLIAYNIYDYLIEKMNERLDTNEN